MRPAMAKRWITKLVDPPMAAFTLIAFSNACPCKYIGWFKIFFYHIYYPEPDNCASTLRLESAAGIAALFGNDKPRDSTIQAIDEAVPITAQ
jgi:hypothetical protein